MKRIIVVGGGIIGITTALEVSKRKIFDEILILEKDNELGSHATVRNSGVIHAGFYYTEDSKKAEFCSEGNNLLRKYCLEKNITINKCGKVVVTKNKFDEETLSLLYKRGLNNGVELELFEKKQLYKYEENAKTFESFLWSPNTWSASPKEVLENLKEDIKSQGIKVLKNVEVVKGDEKKVFDSKGNSYDYDFLVNCAGGYSLNIAKVLGLNSKYKILPFKGLYLKSKEKCYLYKTHIYPVPNIKQPFLGIHTTLTADNFLKLGPTAVPAFSPENYSLFRGLAPSLSSDILLTQLNCFIHNNFDFRKLAFQEVKYLCKQNIINEANKLTNINLNEIDFEWYTPGIRPQLYNIISKNLEMDFIIESSENQLHILNSISPAWTCSLKSSQYIADKIIDLYLK